MPPDPPQFVPTPPPPGFPGAFPMPAHPPTQPAPLLAMWRDGSSLAVPRHAELPACCFKCNQPVEGEPRKVKTSYSNPLWLWLVLAGLPGLIVLLVVAATAKKGSVKLYLCERHRARRRAMILISWVIFLGCIPCFCAASLVREGWPYVMVGIGLILLAPVVWLAAGRTTYCAAMDDDYQHLKRAGPDFLANFADARAMHANFMAPTPPLAPPR